MKLVVDNQSRPSDPEVFLSIPDEVVNEPVINTPVINTPVINQSATIGSLSHIPLSWHKSNLLQAVKEVRINGFIKSHAKNNDQLRDWLYTIITAHILIGPVDGIDYPVPDQFIDLLGSDVLHVEIFSKVCVDVRDRRSMGLELGEMSVHVMN